MTARERELAYWREQFAGNTAVAQRARANNARYKKANRARCSERERLRKAGIRDENHPQFIERVDRDIVYKMHGGCCGICHEFIGGDFHVDHVVPLSKGGKHGYVNVQPAHPLCNNRKYNNA